MKYKIGDKVRIKKSLIVGDRYGGATFFNSMKKEIEENDVVTISDLGVDSNGVSWYDFEELRYSYSEQMIEELVEESTDKKETNNMKYKVGDRVKIRKDLVVGECYDEWVFTEEMGRDIKSNNYILTISKAYIAYDEKTPVYQYEEDGHRTNVSGWELTESMIEGLVEEKESTDKKESNNMKYKVGDRVKIRKDLIVDESYADADHTVCYFTEDMNKVKKEYDYATIKTCSAYQNDRYQICEDRSGYWWSDEMFEESDRHKFERWMRQLSSLDGRCETYDAFNNLTIFEPDDDGYDDNLKIVADYLFGVEKKKMTKAEIEAELGYEIEIVEE